MAALIFDVQQCADNLAEVGILPKHARRFAEVMSETFIYYADKLVTKDYLDARFGEQTQYIDMRFVEQNAYIDKRFAEQDIALEKRFSSIEVRLAQLFWMMGIGFTVLIIPQLQTWLS